MSRTTKSKNLLKIKSQINCSKSIKESKIITQCHITNHPPKVPLFPETPPPQCPPSPQTPAAPALLAGRTAALTAEAGGAPLVALRRGGPPLRPPLPPPLRLPRTQGPENNEVSKQGSAALSKGKCLTTPAVTKARYIPHPGSPQARVQGGPLNKTKAKESGENMLKQISR